MTINIIFGDYVRDIDDTCFEQEDGRCSPASFHGESTNLYYVRHHSDEYILLNDNGELPPETKTRAATADEEQRFGKYFGDLISYAKSINAQFMFNVSDDEISLSCGAPNEPAKPYFENVAGEKQFFSMEDSDKDDKPDKVVISDKDRQLTIAGENVARLQSKLVALSKKISETKCGI